MKKWQGLGYYSRARNMHSTAKFIVKEFKGIFPDDFILLKKLKGIGDYTAAAITSFAFNKPDAVVDGNVLRVISRIFGVKQSVDLPETKRKINKIVSELISTKVPGNIQSGNYGIRGTAMRSARAKMQRLLHELFLLCI